MGCSSAKNLNSGAAGGVSDSSRAPRAATTAQSFQDAYDVDRQIGEGTYARVYLARPRNSQRAVEERAVKVIDLRRAREPAEAVRQGQSAVHEVLVLRVLGGSAHVVQFYECFITGSLCYMVLEKCDRTFYNTLAAARTFDELTVGRMLSQVLLGLRHLHAVGVVHRDVKPDNILCSGEGEGTMKLCDFGLSDFLPSTGRFPGTRMVGTAPFMAPEMVQRCGYDQKVDLWSVGVIVYVLFFGSFPYVPSVMSRSMMRRAIEIGHPQPSFRPVVPEAAEGEQQRRSKEGESFVGLLLTRLASYRPDAGDALNHAFIVRATRPAAAADTVELPSLKPLLESARKAGAFDTWGGPQDGRQRSTSRSPARAKSSAGSQNGAGSPAPGAPVVSAAAEAVSSEKAMQHQLTPKWVAQASYSTTCSGGSTGRLRSSSDGSTAAGWSPRLPSPR